MTSLSKFDQALEWLFDIEGRYSNEPSDRGGPTMFGITQGTYDNWQRSKGLPRSPVNTITRRIATLIYREWYWLPAGSEWLPKVLSICAFDAIVNHPPKVAIALMQSTLGVPADGVIGPVTIKAYSQAVDTAEAVWRFVSLRFDFYAEIVLHDTTQRVLLKGWLRRAHALEKLLGNTAMKGGAM